MATAKSTPKPTTTKTEGGGCHPGERDFWKSLGIPYCEKCCQPRGTDADGLTVCQINQPETCPLVLKE